MKKAMKKKLIKETEIAEMYGIGVGGLAKKKKDQHDQYELVRLGAICKKYGLSEEKLTTLLTKEISTTVKIDNIVDKL